MDLRTSLFKGPLWDWLMVDIPEKITDFNNASYRLGHYGNQIVTNTAVCCFSSDELPSLKAWCISRVFSLSGGTARILPISPDKGAIKPLPTSVTNPACTHLYFNKCMLRLQWAINYVNSTLVVCKYWRKDIHSNWAAYGSPYVVI